MYECLTQQPEVFMEWWNSLSKEDRAELSEMLKEEMVELAEEGIVCI